MEIVGGSSAPFQDGNRVEAYFSRQRPLVMPKNIKGNVVHSIGFPSAGSSMQSSQKPQPCLSESETVLGMD